LLSDQHRSVRMYFQVGNFTSDLAERNHPLTKDARNRAWLGGNSNKSSVGDRRVGVSTCTCVIVMLWCHSSKGFRSLRFLHFLFCERSCHHDCEPGVATGTTTLLDQ